MNSIANEPDNQTATTKLVISSQDQLNSSIQLISQSFGLGRYELETADTVENEKMDQEFALDEEDRVGNEPSGSSSSSNLNPPSGLFSFEQAKIQQRPQRENLNLILNTEIGTELAYSNSHLTPNCSNSGQNRKRKITSKVAASKMSSRKSRKNSGSSECDLLKPNPSSKKSPKNRVRKDRSESKAYMLRSQKGVEMPFPLTSTEEVIDFENYMKSKTLRGEAAQDHQAEDLLNFDFRV